MSQPAAPQFQPVHIGSESDPPDVVLPVPEKLFRARAERLRKLAPDHQLAGYLNFIADICDAQHRILASLPPVKLPARDEVARALTFGMAPIARNRVEIDDTALMALDRLLDAAKSIAMPDEAAAARDGLIACGEGERREAIANVLSDSIPVEEIAEHVFVAAAMQVHFARLAAALPAGEVKNVADGACPACGGPPATSSIVDWRHAQSARFCTCSTCATQWHVVRVKCVACSSTKGIHYFHVEGAADSIRAECCDECHTYLKLLDGAKDPALEPIADDIASAGLDLMVREKAFRRSGFNAFLAGF
jgi:FdhE protein